MSTDGERILRDLGIGDYAVTRHARLRMTERGVTDADVRRCAQTARRIVEQDDGRHRISGLDLAGDSLDLVAVWDGDTVLITVMGG